jgi:DNA-binding NarL/FixJ family response regulator
MGAEIGSALDDQLNVMDEKIRVVLVDDHEMIRQALSQLLSENEQIEVVGEAHDRQSATDILREVEPDVVVLDYSIPGGGGLPVLEELRLRASSTRALVLTMHESIHYALRVLEAGAVGYVIKASAVDDLVEGIRAASRNEVYVSPALSHRVIDHLRAPSRGRAGVHSLSSREFELLRLLGAGTSLGEVAEILNISRSTVSTYRTRLMQKLSLENTAQIIRFAIENDIVG